MDEMDKLAKHYGWCVIAIGVLFVLAIVATILWDIHVGIPILAR